jgi:hypothetical protein
MNNSSRYNLHFQHKPPLKSPQLTMEIKLKPLDVSFSTKRLFLNKSYVKLSKSSKLKSQTTSKLLKSCTKLKRDWTISDKLKKRRGSMRLQTAWVIANWETSWRLSKTSWRHSWVWTGTTQRRWWFLKNSCKTRRGDEMSLNLHLLRLKSTMATTWTVLSSSLMTSRAAFIQIESQGKLTI